MIDKMNGKLKKKRFIDNEEKLDALICDIESFFKDLMHSW